MADSPLSDDSLPLEVHAKIGDLLERFEDACHAKQAPAIEDCLPEVQDQYRAVLLRELLRLELDYRAMVGEQPHIDAYIARFSDHQELVELVFAETRPRRDERSSETLPADLPTFGPYVATRKIGEGGFGVVYLATHHEAEHQVAIKVGEHLMVEAKTLVSLKHPSIVRVLYVGQDARQRPYLVMDYMQGGSLRDRIRNIGPLPPEQATRIALQVAEALHAAHTHPDQIVHRDLKPENILFDEAGDEANAFVADFGLALTEAEQVNHRGDFSGTLPYQSPEQVRGEADWIDGRCDIWAVGVILYEMLTGRRPFADEGLREQILRKDPKPPRSFNDQIPEELQTICLKCLAKDPKDRYQTADSLVRALRNQELGVNPYKGLESFEEADEDNYFGRKEQVKRLHAEFVRLYKASLSDGCTPRIMPIVGPSGCGKSSLAKAGLVPVLRREKFPNRTEIRVEVFRPRMRPLKSLADVLDRLAGGSEDAGVLRSQNFVKAMMQSHGSGEREGLWWIVDSLPRISDAPVVLVIDQFEELFTECEDGTEREVFIENLLHAASRKDGAFSVILTLRSDFLPETQQHERLNEIIASQGVLIPAMKESEIREAITEPARRAGYEFDESVVNLLAKDTKNRDGALPLLQVVLTRIWDGLRQGEKPAESYRKLGGVGGALARAADGVFESLTSDEQQIARRIFLGLVKLGEGTQDARRTAVVSQVLSYKDDPQVARRVLTKFSAKDSRFITLKRRKKEKPGEPDVILAELTHEALLEHWQRLRSWLDTSRSDLRFRDRLNDAAERWNELRRPEGSLWRPPELDVLRQRLPRLEEELNSLQKEFCVASEKHAQDEAAMAEEQRRREENQRKRELEQQKGKVRLLRRVAIVFSLLIVALLGATWWAFKNKALMDKEREVAIQQREIARKNEYLAQMREASLDWELGQIGRLHRTLDTHRSKASQQSYRGWESYYFLSLCHQDQLTFGWHSAPVCSVVWSPDGSLIASSSEDGTIGIWDSESGEVRTILRGHQDWVESLDWSPDGEQLASVSRDGTLRLWDVRLGRARASYRIYGNYLFGVAWSPDGKRLAITGRHGTVKVWDVGAGKEQHNLEHGETWVRWVSWHPDNQRFATASVDGSVKIWDASIGEEIASLRNNTYGVFFIGGLDWSPSGKQLVIGGGDDGTLTVFDLATRQQRVLRRGPVAVISVAWSQNEQHLASGTRDGTVRIWDLSTGLETAVFRGHTGQIRSLAWNPDGQRIASASSDHTVKVWETQNEVPILLRAHTGLGYSFGDFLASRQSVTWSPDGKLFAAPREQNSVIIWEASSWKKRLLLRGHTDQVMAVAWKPTDGCLASSSRDNTIRVWDSRTGDELLRLLGAPKSGCFFVAWHPDGKHLLGRIGEYEFKIWDTTTRQEKALLRMEEHWTPSMSWTPNGQHLAVSVRNEVKVIDTSFLEESNSEIEQIDLASDGMKLVVSDAAHRSNSFPSDQFFSAVAWSPTQPRLRLAAAIANTVYVWDMEDRQQILAMDGHAGNVHSLAWSPDGQRIITGASDESIKIWEASTGREIVSFSGSTGPVWSLAWSPCGKRFASASAGRNTVTIWDASRGFEFANDDDYIPDMATRLFASGEHSRALEVLAQMSNSFPNVPRYAQQLRRYKSELLKRRAKLYRERGKEYRDLEKFDQAIASYSEAIRLDPDLAAAREGRGNTYRELGEFDKAIDDYTEAIRLHPTRTIAFAYRAECYWELRKHDKAKIDSEQTSESDAMACNNRSWELATSDDTRKRKPDWAILLAKRAVTLSPKKGMFWNTLGVAQYRAGKCKDGIESMKKSLEYGEEKDKAYDAFFLAMAHCKLEQSDLARQWFAKAIECLLRRQYYSHDRPDRYHAEAAQLLGVSIDAIPIEAHHNLLDSPHLPNAPLTFIDLQPKANKNITDAISGIEGDDLAELPTGKQTLAGVTFRIDKTLIQLASSVLLDMPQTVMGIPVGESFSRIYLLQASVGGKADDGVTIGEYRVQYADGATESIPIVYGEDVRDFWSRDGFKPTMQYLFSMDSPTPNDLIKLDDRQLPEAVKQAFSEYGKVLSDNAHVELITARREWRIDDQSATFVVEFEKGKLNIHTKKAKVAWVGSNAATRQEHEKTMLRLFVTPWENPHPDKTVAAIDIISSNTTQTGLLCVAMAAEATGLSPSEAID